jgi:hypothetical protein
VYDVVGITNHIRNNMYPTFNCNLALEAGKGICYFGAENPIALNNPRH